MSDGVNWKSLFKKGSGQGQRLYHVAMETGYSVQDMPQSKYFDSRQLLKGSYIL